MAKRAPSRRKEAPDPPLAPRGRLVTLEEGVRLSGSRLWDLQRRFFIEQDPRAWGEGRVPSYVTSNAFIAQRTARVIQGFLDDAAEGRLGGIDPSAPIDVIELGSGSGRFAYGLLRALAQEEETAGRSALRPRVILTDLDEAPVRALRAHPSFAPFVKKGLADFAVFDAEAPGALSLLESGERIQPSTKRNPVVALANYVFDGIRMDAFEVRDGALHESLVRTSCPEGVDPTSPRALSEMRLAFEPTPAPAKVYDEEPLEALLRRVTARLPEGAFLFPVSALRLLRALRALGGGRLLALAADRGHAHEEALLGLRAPQIQRHGSVSFDVNFHVLAEDARASGGEALLPSHHPTHLATVGLLWGAAKGNRTARAYREHLAEGGPGDLFLVNAHIERSGPIDTEHGLAWLRASAWDPEVFLACAPAFLDAADGSDHTVRLDLLDAARRVRERYFPVGGDRDVHLALAELFEAVHALPEALEMFEASMAIHGRDATTLHRAAACASGLHRSAEALALVNEALALDPRHEDARAMRIALEAEMRRRRPS